MPTSLALALPALVPLLLALALLARPLSGPALRAAPLASLAALAVALAWPDGAADLPWLLLGTRLRLDPAARSFLLAAGAVWLAAGLYAAAYLAHDPRRRAFFTSWCLALAGNAGLVVAGDAASFYLCFALMSFASYGLVVHAGTAAAVRAGRVYLALVVVGEVFVFAGLALGAQAAGSLRLDELARAGGASPQRDLIVLCALLGFGVKAGALGLHVWLPLAHPEAPTPASAVLSGVMVKAALVGWLAMLPSAPMPGAGHAVVVLGLAGALYGVAVGLTQGDPKAILAYSTVSQMGLLIAGVGAALSDPGARAASAAVLPLFALHHGLAKGALFLGAGVARGAGRHRRLALASLALPALALAAAPFTSGALAKGSLKALVAASGAGGPAALVLLSLSSAGTFLLLGHFLRTLRLEPVAPGAHQAGRGELLPYLGLVATAMALPFLLGSPGALADRVLEGAWPVALGAVAAFAFAGFPPWPVPPGDVLALCEDLAARVWRPIVAAPRGAPLDAGPWLRLASAWAAGAEARLLAGVASGATLAALLVALHLLLGG